MYIWHACDSLPQTGRQTVILGLFDIGGWVPRESNSQPLPLELRSVTPRTTVPQRSIFNFKVKRNIIISTLTLVGRPSNDWLRLVNGCSHLAHKFNSFFWPQIRRFPVWTSYHVPWIITENMFRCYPTSDSKFQIILKTY